MSFLCTPDAERKSILTKNRCRVFAMVNILYSKDAFQCNTKIFDTPPDRRCGDIEAFYFTKQLKN